MATSAREEAGEQNTGGSTGAREGLSNSHPVACQASSEWPVMNGFIKQIPESEMDSGGQQWLLRLAWTQVVSIGPLLMVPPGGPANSDPPPPRRQPMAHSHIPMEGNPEAILEVVWVALPPLVRGWGGGGFLLEEGSW